MKMEYHHGIGNSMVKTPHIMLSFLEPGQFMKVGIHEKISFLSTRVSGVFLQTSLTYMIFFESSHVIYIYIYINLLGLN